jgi:hypothetical protein
MEVREWSSGLHMQQQHQLSLAESHDQRAGLDEIA